MLFFFTLGASMVGDICDEDDLNTGKRTEGSFYSIYWWFIKMGTALASFVAGSLIVLTLFDQVQVTRVDGIEASVREMRSELQTWQLQGLDVVGEQTRAEQMELFLQRAREASQNLRIHLEQRASGGSRNMAHYSNLLVLLNEYNRELELMDPGFPAGILLERLDILEAHIVPLKHQSEFTLLLMRIVEISLPALLSLLALVFITRYSLVESRLQEIKQLLAERNARFGFNETKE
jgi:GPH family glycoside/pentoside/hexuronide:cation symporter